MLLVFGSMHGNEPAGVNAINFVGKMLDVEPITNEDFYYCGSFIGMVGNKRAVKKGERFLQKDLNRSWTLENVGRVMSSESQFLCDEDLEMREILDTIEELRTEIKPTKIIVLDLHTTSSYGGIFSIPTEDEESLKIAKELHAPVIKGMLNGITGTVLHYFNEKNLGIPTVTVAFESGQHEEKLSTNRAIAAIINCMRTIEAIDPNHVENQHDKILIEYSQSLPKVVSLIAKYAIQNNGKFVMKPDYSNFQKIKKGEILAMDADEQVVSPDDGLLLMPLYQKRGDDGFFVVQEV